MTAQQHAAAAAAAAGGEVVAAAAAAAVSAVEAAAAVSCFFGRTGGESRGVSSKRQARGAAIVLHSLGEREGEGRRGIHRSEG